MNLHSHFTDLVSRYSKVRTHSKLMWEELSFAYAEPARKYHTLTHLEDLLKQLLPLQPQIENWDAVLFALFYHDAVYNTMRHDNEEESAELAKRAMQMINVPSEIITRTVWHILATKSHMVSDDRDTNLFTDADLCILGSSAERYTRYAQEIRSEYRVYPDIVYKPGRRKVLTHFLEMERIFKTEYFYSLYEAQARMNLANELERL